MQVLVSGDECGKINIWCLTNQCLQILKCIEPSSCASGSLTGQSFSQSNDNIHEFPVTTLSLWNKIGKGSVELGCQHCHRYYRRMIMKKVVNHHLLFRNHSSRIWIWPNTHFLGTWWWYRCRNRCTCWLDYRHGSC